MEENSKFQIIKVQILYGELLLTSKYLLAFPVEMFVSGFGDFWMHLWQGQRNPENYVTILNFVWWFRQSQF